MLIGLERILYMHIAKMSGRKLPIMLFGKRKLQAAFGYVFAKRLLDPYAFIAHPKEVRAAELSVDAS